MICFFSSPVIIRMRLCMHWRQKKKKKELFTSYGRRRCVSVDAVPMWCVRWTRDSESRNAHTRPTNENHISPEFEHREKQRISADGFGWRASDTCDRRMCGCRPMKLDMTASCWRHVSERFTLRWARWTCYLFVTKHKSNGIDAAQAVESNRWPTRRSHIRMRTRNKV